MNDTERRIKNIELAMFGDSNGNKGMKEQFDELYDLMRAYILIGKLLKYFFWLVATGVTIIVGWKQFLH